jgi:hypothetical protein
MRFIWQHPKAAASLKVEFFRAQILLESLHNGVSRLGTQEVIKSLTISVLECLMWTFWISGLGKVT